MQAIALHEDKFLKISWEEKACHRHRLEGSHLFND
jgi:hypothetical protein